MTSARVHLCEVAVIGAGPYGLSAAAHLRHAGCSVRVFGEPMSFWRSHMPKGMLLRSPWRATHLSSPDNSLSLDAYAAKRGLDGAKLLPLEDFIAYGQWFQSHAVPESELERRPVRFIDKAGDRFRLTLADGASVLADRVVVATGLRNQDYRPAPFAGMPAALVTHTCEHTDFAPFRGKHVAVIGRGQSACESAALLSEAGAEVEIVSRAAVHWLGAAPAAAPAPKPAMRRLRAALEAPSAVGPFPLSWLAELPAAVCRLPDRLRDDFTRRCLRPGAAAWLKPRFDSVTCTTAGGIAGVRAVAGGVAIDLDTGPKTFDHVVLGTGYRIDLTRLGILAPQLLEKIDCADGSPLLRAGFESSVRRLHFVGSYAVRSYGPLLRFIAGAPFAARGVAKTARAGRLSDKTAVQFYHAALKTIGSAAPHLSPPR